MLKAGAKEWNLTWEMTVGGGGGVLKTEARSDLERGTPPSVCVHSQCSFA